MKIPPKLVILLFLTMPLILVACTSATATTSPTQAPTTPITNSLMPSPTQPSIAVDSPTLETQSTQPVANETQQSEDLSRQDAQGNVTVNVTPLNLDNPGETLDFDVVMETHSVDLSMDLSVLAVLNTDTGRRALPAKWDAPMGGHHVSGTLSFPASTDGVSLLAGAKTLTLILQDVDAPERIFIWNLPSE